MKTQEDKLPKIVLPVTTISPSLIPVTVATSFVTPVSIAGLQSPAQFLSPTKFPSVSITPRVVLSPRHFPTVGSADSKSHSKARFDLVPFNDVRAITAAATAALSREESCDISSSDDELTTDAESDGESHLNRFRVQSRSRVPAVPPLPLHNIQLPAELADECDGHLRGDADDDLGLENNSTAQAFRQYVESILNGQSLVYRVMSLVFKFLNSSGIVSILEYAMDTADAYIAPRLYSLNALGSARSLSSCVSVDSKPAAPGEDPAAAARLFPLRHRRFGSKLTPPVKQTPSIQSPTLTYATLCAHTAPPTANQTIMSASPLVTSTTPMDIWNQLPLLLQVACIPFVPLLWALTKIGLRVPLNFVMPEGYLMHSIPSVPSWGSDLAAAGLASGYGSFNSLQDLAAAESPCVSPARMISRSAFVAPACSPDSSPPRIAKRLNMDSEIDQPACKSFGHLLAVHWQSALASLWIMLCILNPFATIQAGQARLALLISEAINLIRNLARCSLLLPLSILLPNIIKHRLQPWLQPFFVIKQS